MEAEPSFPRHRSGLVAEVVYVMRLWRWWFPDQEFNPTIKRWLRYLLQLILAGIAYVEVRANINLLTGVDPGNFPTALTTLTVLNTLRCWVLPLLVIAFVSVLWKMFTSSLREMLGASVVWLVTLTLGLMLATPPWPVGRLFVTNVLVAAEFSYDQTCAVSSEHRLVAQLKDRKERSVTMVSIAEEGPVAWWFFRNFAFSTGTCAEQKQP